MIARQSEARLRELLKVFPLVGVLGPRQCGKTTFIRAALPDWDYLDLEKPSDLVRLSEDPEGGVSRLENRFILDEAQRLPALFPVLRGWVDAHRAQRGRGVLLGSASLSLVRQMSETLAGRIGFLDLTPFQWAEVRGNAKRATVETLWFRGGFPDAFLESSHRARRDWYEAYTRTFIERDLRALGIEFSAPQMRKLWTMLAHVHGTTWNASQLAASLGVSFHTVNRYTDILEQTFLIRKLPPYFANIGKRLVKSPKVYFRDTGLLHYFLGIHEPTLLDVHPMRGASWEGYVLEQMIGLLQIYASGAQAFFWRTAAGTEVDLLIQYGAVRVPFEIKLHAAPSRAMTAGLTSCMKDLKLTRGYLLYPGRKDYSLGEGITALSAEELLGRPERLVALLARE